MERSIYLFRHAEPLFGAHNICRGSGKDDALSESGIFQTEVNIQYLSTIAAQQMKDVLLVTSPLQRARFFGDRMRALCEVEHIVDEELTDLHVGDWEGRTWQEIDRLWPEQSTLCWTNARELQIPGAQESIADFESRVLGRWNYWVQQSPEKLLAFCIHKCSLKVILDHSANRPLTFNGQRIACMNEVLVSVTGDVISAQIIQEDQKILVM